MSKHITTLAAAVAVLVLLAAPAWAQTQQAPPPALSPGAQAPLLAPGTVEGDVKHVDPAAQTISISSGWLGFLFGKTLVVAPDTQITVAGTDANLTAIREGAKVRAAYETRNGKMIATRIEVL